MIGRSEFQSSRSLRTATFERGKGPLPGGISILAVLADRDNFSVKANEMQEIFQSSRSLRTATASGAAGNRHPMYFNPRGPCGPRRRRGPPGRRCGYFNPRGPCGPRRRLGAPLVGVPHISILAVLADRDGGTQARDIAVNISILAVLADRDSFRLFSRTFLRIFQSSRSLRTATGKSRCRKSARPYFNPRGPCGPRHQEPDLGRLAMTFQSSRSLRPATRNCRILWGSLEPFQSSRSLRTATLCAAGRLAAAQYFNPRGPCGPRPVGLDSHPAIRQQISILAVLADRDLAVDGLAGPADQISILAVLADRDAAPRLPEELGWPFQSSRSLRTATEQSLLSGRRSTYFNPRGPCGPRLFPLPVTVTDRLLFQSSRSLRTATFLMRSSISSQLFQSSRSLRTATSV